MSGHFDSYVTCKICGGKGRFPQRKRVGSKMFTMSVRCDFCQGTGEVMASKIKHHPLHDRYGRPIDERGRLIKNPEHEVWWRKYARQVDMGFRPRQVA